MLVVKADIVILYKGGRLVGGDELTDKILKRHPHLKKHGEERKKGKEDPAKG